MKRSSLSSVLEQFYYIVPGALEIFFWVCLLVVQLPESNTVFFSIKGTLLLKWFKHYT
jgi:hypothetical protein